MRHAVSGSSFSRPTLRLYSDCENLCVIHNTIEANHAGMKTAAIVYPRLRDQVTEEQLFDLTPITDHFVDAIAGIHCWLTITSPKFITDIRNERDQMEKVVVELK